MTEILNFQPKRIDLWLYAGDGVNFKLTIRDPEGQTINLTGSTIKAQIRYKVDSVEPAAVFSVNLDEATSGIVKLSLTKTQTQELAAEKKFVGIWDLEWTALGAEPKTICQGKAECVQDVSR
jgi:phosphoribosylformylglycinamidine (FGAM) synthase PurS component